MCSLDTVTWQPRGSSTERGGEIRDGGKGRKHGDGGAPPTKAPARHITPEPDPSFFVCSSGVLSLTYSDVLSYSAMLAHACRSNKHAVLWRR